MIKNELKNLISEYGPRVNRRSISLGIIIFIIIFSVVITGELKKLPNGKLQVVFCDVGQGDAIYLKTPKGLDILVDGGPDNKVLSCLGRHMPFWDRKIEMVFLTHPHSDHQTGIVAVRQRYQVGEYFANNLTAGDKITTIDGVIITVLWPSAGWQTDDTNNTSLVLKVNNILLTGDAALSVIGPQDGFGGVDIFKVPHHGSKTSLDETVLKLISPKIAVISAGKDNSFGHPAPETISLLEKYGTKIRRTDLEGEIILTP